MNNQITQKDINENTFFWYSYISCFRGYDAENEINIDEALEIIDIDKNELYKWEQIFFSESDLDEDVRFIGGKLNDEMSFYIEFQKSEIIYFINDIYIGNLGGHFEAWFLTWEELLAFEKYNHLFLLLLPMTGIEQHQIETAKTFVTKHLKTIPGFEKDAEYIAYCILNGLIIEEKFFNQNNIGITNNANHSVRNLNKYPRYKGDVIELNLALEKFIESR